MQCSSNLNWLCRVTVTLRLTPPHPTPPHPTRQQCWKWFVSYTLRLYARWVFLCVGQPHLAPIDDSDENMCKACGDKRLTFEPPSLYCTCCGQRIKRNQVQCRCSSYLKFCCMCKAGASIAGCSGLPCIIDCTVISRMCLPVGVLVVPSLHDRNDTT